MNTLTYVFIIIILCISCWEVGADGTFNELYPATDLPLPSDASGQALAANVKNGAYLSFSAKGIQEFATSLLNAQPSSCTTFRGFSAEVNVNCVRNVSVKIENFKLLEKIGGSVNVTVVNGVGLKVVAKDMKLNISIKWNYKHCYLVDSGVATIEASDMQMDFMLTFMETSSRFTTRECSGSFSKLEVNSGEASGEDDVKRHLSNIFSNPCRLLRLTLEIVSGTLKGLAVTESIHTDFSLTKAPVFSGGEVGLFMKGEFYPAGSFPTSPFNPGNMNPDNDDKLFNVLLSTETIKSISKAFFKEPFTKRLTWENMSGSKDQYRISCNWDACIGKNFPTMIWGWSNFYVEFDLIQSTAPKVELKNDGIHFTFSGFETILSAVKGSEREWIKRYYSTFEIIVVPRLENGRTLKWTAETKSFRMERFIDYRLSIDNFISVFFNDFLYLFQVEGWNGVELPLNLCLKLLNSKLNVKNGKLRFGGDMRYSG